MKKAINHGLMKTINRQRILDFIRKKSPVSKKDVADSLETSITSVSTVFNELLQEEKIVHCGTSQSTGGRKSELFQLNPDALYIIGVDIQVSQLIFVLLNLNGAVVLTNTIKINDTDEWSTVSLLKKEIESLCKHAGIEFSKIGGIGIGIPGIVNQDLGLVEFAPNLGWKNVFLSELLALDFPIFIENEANAAAWGEKTFGAARLSESLIYISIDIGVGTGLIFGNRIFGGANNYAGEFGHMTINPEGPICQCGNQGCWETYVSNKAAIKRYQEKSGHQALTYEEFLNKLRNGDPVAVAVNTEIILYLGIGIANITNSLNPETIIIGGAISEVKDIIYTDLIKEIKNRCLEKTFTSLSLRFSEFNGKASALGVASILLDKLFK